MVNFLTAVPCNFRPSRFFDSRSAAQRTAVAVSACLAGEKVRYDGADKLLPAYPLLRKELNLLPICPEMGAGLGVPRPPVQLIEISTGRIRALGREDHALDVTSALQSFAALSLQNMASKHCLCGYLWKSRSPSCGLDSTPLFSTDGIEINRTSGIQAEYFKRQLPHLNYREETALETAEAVASFVLRCRLVFDTQYSSDAPLQEMHQHYAFLHKNFDDHIAENLNVLSGMNSRTDYLAAFLSGCNQMPDEVLLSFFN